MIRLGQKVRCKITGFEGIATARAVFLNGCVRITVDAPYKPNEKGELCTNWIDEQYLEVIGETEFSEPATVEPTPIPERRAGGPPRKDCPRS